MPAPKVGLLVSVVMEAEVAMRLVMVADEEVRVVTFAEAMLRFDSTRLVAVRLVTEADVAVRVVMEAEVAIKSVIVALPDRNTVAEASAVVKLPGFVPSSIMALEEFMLKTRLSAVLTAISAPPAKLVRSLPVGAAPGVSLFLIRIVGISKRLRSRFQWHSPDLNNNFPTHRPANRR